MTKKLLPTMIGALLVGGMAAAQADVTVMGHIDTSVDAIDNDVTGLDDTNLNCTTCSVGFKGSEDLGNGLKAIFKLDFQYDSTERNTGKAKASKSTFTTTGGQVINPVTGVSDTSSITDRDQWLGLAGNFGQVRIGTISTVYKSHGAAIDPLYRTSLQGRTHGLQTQYFHAGAGEELNGRATNTIRYDSPSWNGLKVGATFTLDGDENDGEDDNPYGAGVSYENGGILVFVDYLNNNQGGNTEINAAKIGGKYTLNNFAIMGQYESTELRGGDQEPTQWHVGGSYTIGNNLIYAAYGQGDPDVKSVDDTTAWTVAGIHKMSKRTSVYAGYNAQDFDGPDATQFSVGMKHKF